jgi:hypothetical protein
MLQAANGSFKTTIMIPLTQGDLCPPDCRKIVAMYGAVVVLFALKRNRHNTFLACRNCRRDRTRVYLDNTVVTVVNCCQLVATRFFFMFPFGREHYFDDSYNHMETRLNRVNSLLINTFTLCRYKLPLIRSHFQIQQLVSK